MEPSVQERKGIQIKGIGNNLTVLLDPRQPAADLKEELKRIFDPLKHLSANGHVVLDTGDPEGHRELVEELGSFLKAHYRIENRDRAAQGPHRGAETLRQ
jgi:hypothetical protein